MQNAILLGLLAGVSGTVSEDRACHFVGSRFARIHSTCLEGVCTNFVKFADGSFSHAGDGALVPCAEAVGVVRSFLRSHSQESRPRKRLRRDRDGDGPFVVEQIKTHVLRPFHLISFLGNASMEDIRTCLEEFDNGTLGMAATDWDRWTEATAPYVTASPEWAALGTATQTILRLWLFRSFMYDEILVGLLRFYFDISALFMHSIDLGRILVANRAVEFRSPLHRPRHALDGHTVGSEELGVPTVTARLTQVYDSFAAFGSTGGLSLTFMRDIVQFLSGFDPRDSRVTSVLMADRVRTVCPVLKPFVSRLMRAPLPHDYSTKICVSLLDLCRGSVPLAELLDSRQALLGFLGLVVTAAAPPPGGAAEWLKGPESTRSLAGTPADRAATASRIIVELVASSPATPGQLSITDVTVARNTGRAIAHGLLNGGDLRPLGFPQAAARFLYNKSRDRVELSDVLELNRDLPGVSSSMFLALVAGVTEAISPGGAEIFTESEWLAAFGF